MNCNNLPIIKKENFFTRISNFIKNIFHVSNKKQSNISEIDNNANTFKQQLNSEFKEYSKKIQQSEKEKETIEEIIKIVELHPKVLEELDINKLEIIDNYYTQKIKEYKNSISVKA